MIHDNQEGEEASIKQIDREQCVLWGQSHRTGDGVSPGTAPGSFGEVGERGGPGEVGERGRGVSSQ